jgi:putative FmdB family regulatory protein
MPTYEYNCQKCGKTFEVFQSMKDERLKICTCGQKGKVKRLPGRGAGIIFKGSGFYETDYRRHPGRTEPPAAEPGKAAGGKEGSAPPPTPSGPAPAPPSTTPAKE